MKLKSVVIVKSDGYEEIIDKVEKFIVAPKEEGLAVLITKRNGEKVFYLSENIVNVQYTLEQIS